jgi:hypothetical protein
VKPSVLAAALIVGGAIASARLGAAPSPEAAPIVGRWDLTVTAGKRSHPAWLEVEKSGNRTLVGRFVGEGGSARPISKIEFADNVMRFSIPPQWESGDADLYVEGTWSGGRLSGFWTSPSGERATWTATRAPSLRRAAPPQWGRAKKLFNDSDTTGWRPIGGESQWRVVSGVLTNVKSGANFVTEEQFTDFRLQLEFRYPKRGNSGVYLRGRYEVQVEDSPGSEPDSHHLGGVYGFLTPSEHAGTSAGEWQAFDITLVGRMVSVALNGKPIIVNQEIPGITGGALDSDEGAPGPIMLQGDHGPVEFRNIVLTPAR